MLRGVMVGGLSHLPKLQYSCQPGAYGTYAGIRLEKMGHGPRTWRDLVGSEVTRNPNQLDPGSGIPYIMRMVV